MKIRHALCALVLCVASCSGDGPTGPTAVPGGAIGKWHLVSSSGRTPPYELPASYPCWGPSDTVTPPVRYYLDSLWLDFETDAVEDHPFISNEWDGGRATCDYSAYGTYRFTRDTMYVEWIGAPSGWPVRLEPRGDTLIVTWLPDAIEVYRR